ncbi:MAG: cytochrome c biogenesis protein [Actinomycetota bacterium]|nr:cytochrome c biogenesis protein [Actinomycetota bacterium]
MSRGAVERVLGVLAALAAAALVVVGLLVAPPDAVQGQAQRLMYVHVPAAWVAYLAFATVLVCSVAYLVRRDLAWDRRAQAAAELGVGLTALAIMLGSIWGRPVWGVWWTWDPRLVTTVVLLLVYIGYLGVRGLAVDPHVNARRAAVVGVAGFVNVPLVHFSVVWWRTLHQPPTVLRPDGPASAIEPVMLAALLTGVVAFTLGAGWLYLRRLRVLALRAGPPPVGVGARTAPSVTVLRGDGQ